MHIAANASFLNNLNFDSKRPRRAVWWFSSLNREGIILKIRSVFGVDSGAYVTGAGASRSHSFFSRLRGLSSLSLFRPAQRTKPPLPLHKIKRENLPPRSNQAPPPRDPRDLTEDLFTGKPVQISNPG